ncbi:MAG: hypothetical protein ABW133_10260 [Polyangiaceae bacterium]
MAILAPLPFAESLAGRFVYDDHLLIEEPASVHALSRLFELWQGEFWRGLGAIHFRYLRPLVSTSYAVDWALWEGHPLGFHLTNLCLHAAVTVLLYGALARWSGFAAGAFLAALAWAWHPSKVEAVSWIAGRTDVMCALGILIACEGARRRIAGKLGWGATLETLGVFIALTSKEHGVVVPLFVALEAWVHARGSGAIRRALRVAAPHAVAVAAYLAFRFAFYPIVPERTAALSFVDARLFTLETLGELAKVVFVPTELSILRAPIRVDAAFRVLHDPVRLASGFALLAALAVALFTWQRRGAAFRVAGALLGIGALLPVVNVASAKNVFLFAERFAYIPLMGFALCFVPRLPWTIAQDRDLAPRSAWRALPWWLFAPWSLSLAFCALATALHTRDFLDDRRLWEHELAVNPAQPLPLRFACQDAMHRQRHRDALRLAMRGYEASQGWPAPQPDRVEFALRAARSLEAVTLDADRGKLERIADFYDVFFAAAGHAALDAPPVRVAFESRGGEAKNFRAGDPARMAEVELWRAIVASRLNRCDVARRGAARYLAETRTPTGRVSAVLALARCDAWDQALHAARALDLRQPPIAELVRNLESMATASVNDRYDLDSALEHARARTLVLDRGGAYRAIEPWRSTILTDERGTVFFARTAWAAGEDEAARSALATRFDPAQIDALLTAWSNELGR